MLTGDPVKGARKTREWKRWHEVTRVENAGVEKAARDDMGGKRGSGKRGSRQRGTR